YCARDPSLPFTEVQASTPVDRGSLATATTPPCPAGSDLTSGGFSFNGSESALFGGGWVNQDGPWSASGLGYFRPAPALTAYGYCLAPADAEVSSASGVSPARVAG